MDSLYGGWTGLNYIPSPIYWDSSHVHCQFVQSDVPETPLLFRYYLDGQLEEESVVRILEEEELTFAGYWFLEVQSETFKISLIVNETDYSPTDTLIGTLHLAEYATDANTYSLSKCYPPIDIHGFPSFLQYQDEDGDGYGVEESSIISCDELDNFSFTAGDCNDADENINPGAPEIGGNDIDEDCDGLLGTSSNSNTQFAQLEIYPNPTSDEIIINTESLNQFELTIFSIHGENLGTYLSPTQIDMSHLPSGTYFVRYIIPASKSSGIEKIVKI